MPKSDIQWYDGSDEPGARASTTIPTEPKASAGGPIQVPDGVDEGHSFGVPDKPANAVSEPTRGKGSPISGPLDV